MSDHTDQPSFGSFPLNRREQTARRLAADLSGGTIDKLFRSILWRYAGGTQRRPRDVTIFETQKVRLHPYDNICEKRVFLTPQLWEPSERALLAEQIARHKRNIFYFVDAGANVGLYTLFARHCVHKAGLAFLGLAVEPGTEQSKRLAFNLAASAANEEVALICAGLSDTDGIGSFAANTDNLGESKLTSGAGSGFSQKIRTRSLHAIITEQQWPRIDALKIDIEGRETDVMAAFFTTAPKELWPQFVILEIAHATSEDRLVGLFKDYEQLQERRGLVVLRRRI